MENSLSLHYSFSHSYSRLEKTAVRVGNNLTAFQWSTGASLSSSATVSKSLQFTFTDKEKKPNKRSERRWQNAEQASGVQQFSLSLSPQTSQSPPQPHGIPEPYRGAGTEGTMCPGSPGTAGITLHTAIPAHLAF